MLLQSVIRQNMQMYPEVSGNSEIYLVNKYSNA